MRDTTALPHIYPYNLFPCIKIQNRRITMTKLSGQESLTPPVRDYDRRRPSPICIFSGARSTLARKLAPFVHARPIRARAAAFPSDRQCYFFSFFPLPPPFGGFTSARVEYSTRHILGEARIRPRARARARVLRVDSRCHRQKNENENAKRRVK